MLYLKILQVHTTHFKETLVIKYFDKSLDFVEVMWYCVVLTGGATNGKHN